MTERYRVELIGFPGLTRERAVAHLSEAFDLALAEALIYVDALPCIVRSDVDGETAKEYARELLRAGADVAIVGETSGRRVVHEANALKERIDKAIAAAAAQTPAAQPAAASPAGAPAAPTSAKVAAAPAEAGAEAVPEPVAESAPAPVENVYCPRCGHRQPAAEQCSECGHAFAVASKPKRAAASASAAPAAPETAPPAGENGAEVDVFGSLKHVHADVVAKPVQPLRAPSRRTGEFSLDLPAVGRRRRFIWIFLLLAAAAAVALWLMQPDEGIPPDGPLPEDAIPAPPGLRYRRL